ncbi:restriction endonuclease subunit S [Shewanella sp. MMG014]|uniref:restriction endonuclease subunit S n=1 Tax=Shewanella sp. MMG014 TaxID=2822691 RepID=UPI001B3878F2|nr:restriction endonuclease subunit S [Shewanella sp. MMG014]MBQ4892169.1 restriction endonuclease subunit S [Shewanella sp. MMG014]
MSFDIKVPDGWTLVKLSDLGEVNRGRSRHRPRDAAHLYNGPYPFVQTGDVKASGGRITQFSQTYSEAGLAQSRLWPTGTMCITIAANIAETGILTFPACFPDSVIGFIADEKKCNVYFIEFVFRLLRKRIQAQATGSVQDNINLQTLERLQFPIPTLDEQNRIAEILGKLDDKIYLNTNTNQTLEQMAQAIFKSWFVDFEPVKAKMNGEQPEGMDAATASLFPEKLVESELGLIPEGWSVEEAKSQLDVLRGFSYKGKGLVGSLDEGAPMHNLNSILEGGGYKYAGLKFYSEEFKEKFAIQEGDVLVANTEQGHNHLLIGYGVMVPKHLAHGFFSHHTYRVRPKKNSNMTPEFIERLFGKGRFVRQVQGFTNGTTVNMLPVVGMEMPQFVVPPKALAQKFSELVKPMKAMIEENHKTNIELAKLRDTLLPKLLSGEIELTNVEAKLND